MQNGADRPVPDRRPGLLLRESARAVVRGKCADAYGTEDVEHP